MKTRTIFSLTLLVLILYGVFFFSFYVLDLFKIQHAYTKEGIQLELSNLIKQMEDEKNNSASTLYSLHALFNAQKSTLATNEGRLQFSQDISELMQNRPNQFNAYFALEEPLAMQLVNKKAWVLTTKKDINYKNSSNYNDPENRIIQEFFDPTYQTSKEEVWYHVAKRSHNVEFSDIYFDESYMKEWMFTAGLGIYDKGIFQGMVGVDILLDSFFSEVERKSLNNTGGFFLVDKNTGVILTKITQQNSLFGVQDKRQQLSLKSWPLWQELTTEKLTYKKITNEDGETYRISTQALSDSDWILVAFQNERLAFLTLYKKVFHFAGISILLIVFVGVIIGSLLKQLSSTTLKLDKNTEALKRSESRFNVVFDQASEFMGLVDTNGNLEEVNNSVVASSLTTKESLLHSPVWEAPWWQGSDPWWQGSEETKEKVKEAILKAKNGTATIQELTYQNHLNELRYLSFSVSPIRDDNDQVDFLFLTARDITKQKEIETSLKEAMEMAELSNIAKSEFLANMSHEIRTPMNGVLGMLQLLQNASLSEEQKKQVEIAAKSAHSLLRIIDDILDISKIEAGKMSIQMQPFSLRESVDHVVALMQHRAEEKGLTLTLNFPETDAHVIGDAGRIEQVLKNLVSNAIKFTEKGSVTITVNLELKNHHYYELYCSVEDTGIGIASDQLDTLFKPFSQVDPSSSRHYEGTGLGLHISKQLCFLMGGSLNVASTLGEGSTFYFRLLLQRQMGDTNLVSRHTDTHTLPISGWMNNKKVLLVEDNEVNQMVAKKMLENLGLHCDVVNSGSLALSVLQSTKEPYSTIFMDCQMPEMDGYEATGRIRNGEAGNRYKDIPIIALTAHAMEGDRERCLIAGMDDYVVKPIEQKELKNALMRVLTNENTGEEK